MKKSLLYSLALCATLSVLVVSCLTEGFRDFGAAKQYPLMPLFWGTVLFAWLLEPPLFTEFVQKKLRTCTDSNVILRGIVSGVVIFGLWTCLYLVSRKYKDAGENAVLALLIIGYVSTVIVGILGAVIRRNPTPPAVSSQTGLDS